MQGSEIRHSIRTGQRVYGVHISHAGGAYYLKKSLGLNVEFVFIDTEHVPMDRSDVALVCGHFSGHGLSPAVRILNPDLHLAAAALDAGAEGIVVPYIESVDEIAEMAAVVRYRPLKGERLSRVASGEEQLSDDTEKYLLKANENHYFLIGIESVPAMDNLEALLSVAGVDGVFIGPHDLSLSLEVPEQYQHPRFVEAVLTIIRTARKAGVGAGMHIKPDTAPPEPLNQYIDAGLNWILYSHDVTIMVEAANQQLDRIRSIHGDSFETPSSSESTAPEI